MNNVVARRPHTLGEGNQEAYNHETAVSKAWRSVSAISHDTTRKKIQANASLTGLELDYSNKKFILKDCLRETIEGWSNLLRELPKKQMEERKTKIYQGFVSAARMEALLSCRVDAPTDLQDLKNAIEKIKRQWNKEQIGCCTVISGLHYNSTNNFNTYVNSFIKDISELSNEHAKKSKVMLDLKEDMKKCCLESYSPSYQAIVDLAEKRLLRQITQEEFKDFLNNKVRVSLPTPDQRLAVNRWIQLIENCLPEYKWPASITVKPGPGHLCSILMEDFRANHLMLSRYFPEKNTEFYLPLPKDKDADMQFQDVMALGGRIIDIAAKITEAALNELMIDSGQNSDYACQILDRKDTYYLTALRTLSDAFHLLANIHLPFNSKNTSDEVRKTVNCNIIPEDWPSYFVKHEENKDTSEQKRWFERYKEISKKINKFFVNDADTEFRAWTRIYNDKEMQNGDVPRNPNQPIGLKESATTQEGNKKDN